MKKKEYLKKIIRKQLDELHHNDLNAIDYYGGKIADIEKVGDFELALVDIWGVKRVALTHADYSFFSPDSQRMRRDTKKNPRIKFPLKKFTETLLEWCKKYGVIAVESYNPRNQRVYMNVINRSNLFDIVKKTPVGVYIKAKKL